MSKRKPARPAGPAARRQIYLCHDRILSGETKLRAMAASVKENPDNRPRMPGRLMGVSMHPIKMALFAGKRWRPGRTLRCFFMDGSAIQRRKVQEHAVEWTRWANINLDFGQPRTRSDIRISFQAEYGASKLDYPWFADSPVDRFDSIVLRAGGSKTWLDFRDPSAAQYLHDAFARDTARDMGVIDGHAVDLDPNGCLIVERDGRLHTYSSGDVTLVRPT